MLSRTPKTQHEQAIGVSMTAIVKAVRIVQIRDTRGGEGSKIICILQPRTHNACATTTRQTLISFDDAPGVRPNTA